MTTDERKRLAEVRQDATCGFGHFQTPRLVIIWLISLAEREAKRADEWMTWWAANWDCSRTPGHPGAPSDDCDMGRDE